MGKEAAVAYIKVLSRH